MVLYNLGKDIISLELPDAMKKEMDSTDISAKKSQIVKFGPRVSTVEAQNLWMIKKVFGYVFIYMELKERPTRAECWDSLSNTDRRPISNQLTRIMKTLRQLEQDPSNQLVGMLTRMIKIFQYQMGGLPSFGSINWKHLQDYFTFPHRYNYPDRCLLPDTGEINFTHADLDWRNIIVSSFNPGQVVVIDWQQSG
ncbi:hypothetical protein BDV23DRAFT_176789 [Aspergillus alliaceus]|uniref:Aminoglycoside phosphotransferase domain-containing protein n=1 Tax=Petromyces alliaceus TaxID=209559 RepID=A0A5N7BSF2_PETAA|nr:hypothetical protein BDV23DRAFT_176789 [Aspergillus alliaceus]